VPAKVSESTVAVVGDPAFAMPTIGCLSRAIEEDPGCIANSLAFDDDPGEVVFVAHDEVDKSGLAVSRICPGVFGVLKAQRVANTRQRQGVPSAA